MKTYTHVPPVDVPQVVQDNRPDGRVYITPEGNTYPSVTTVLGIEGAEEIEKWKAAVGEEEARLTSARAAARGTRIHQLCEDTLNNAPTEPNLFDMEAFAAMKKALVRIDNVHAVELRLFSDILKIAGTVDLIAEFDGELSIIDWKTSGRLKYRDDIHGYFMQCSAYAVAYEERTGRKVKNIVIVMAVDGDPMPAIFIEKVKDWVPHFIQLRKKFKQLKGF
jgi:ATP-dependent exoDNAse (exonuclease V) beta subunit